MDNIASLNDLQSLQSVDYGEQAARYADPFMDDRKKYQNQLSKLMQNPGSMKSSPFYKFAYNQGLNALQRTGSVRSGNKLAELMKYGQGMASQNFFPMMDRLSNLAMSGSNPGMAGGAYAIGTQRSQDYASQAAAARNAPTGGAQIAPSTPWWMQGAEQDYDRMLNSGASSDQAWWDRYNSSSVGIPGGGSFTYDPKTDPYIQNVMNQYFPQGGASNMGYYPSDPRYTAPSSAQPTYGATDLAAMNQQNYYGYDNG